MAGILYLVPTPIGNLEDITFRSVRILKEVDFILAEDTRKSGVLLSHYDIQTRMISYHQHNEHKVYKDLTGRILEGETAALITDAGTPGISDPGFLIVRECVEKNLKVECLPGATAFVPALVKSGLPSDSFVFEGFLPQKKGRQTKVKLLAAESRTIILYESPYRILKLLGEVVEYFGENRRVSVSRELTKMYEETLTDTAENLLKHFKNNPIKGEFVVIIDGKHD